MMKRGKEREREKTSERLSVEESKELEGEKFK